MTVGAFEHDVTTASHPGSTARLGRFRAPLEPRKTAWFAVTATPTSHAYASMTPSQFAEARGPIDWANCASHGLTGPLRSSRPTRRSGARRDRRSDTSNGSE